MAIAGGSYGGYLVSWLTALTDRYAASICHAGVTDLPGQWASDHTAEREHAVGGVPWEDTDAVQRWSPMIHTHDIVTPTLVIHANSTTALWQRKDSCCMARSRRRGSPLGSSTTPTRATGSSHATTHCIGGPNSMVGWIGGWCSHRLVDVADMRSSNHGAGEQERKAA